jgi:alpha-1,4-N-acetylglucosaminyltransferase EXTL2
MVPLVHQVLLVWNDNETDLWTEGVDCPAGKKAPIKVLQQKYNTLLNRYAVWPEVHTEGVLLLDDDVLMSGMSNLTKMFKVWQKHPTQVVGLWGNCPYKQDGKFLYVYHNCQEHFSITTGQGNMVHRNYMQMFMAKQPMKMLEFMYTQRPTCEDVALSFLASNHTGLPPLVTPDVWEDVGDSIDRVEMHWSFGTRDDWLSLRGACMDKFVEWYGRDPLAPTLPA